MELTEHLPLLNTWAGQLCRSTAEAEDLVQDTAVRAWAAMASGAPRGQETAWLFTVMRSAYIDKRRSRWARVRLVGDARRHEVPAMPADGAAWDDERLLAAMASLDDIVRPVLELRLLHGRSYEEIALLLGIPEGTVGTRLLRAKRLMRAALGD